MKQSAIVCNVCGHLKSYDQCKGVIHVPSLFPGQLNSPFQVARSEGSSHHHFCGDCLESEVNTPLKAFSYGKTPSEIEEQRLFYLDLLCRRAIKPPPEKPLKK